VTQRVGSCNEKRQEKLGWVITRNPEKISRQLTAGRAVLAEKEARGKKEFKPRRVCR
jgi:hypothetical protein